MHKHGKTGGMSKSVPGINTWETRLQRIHTLSRVHTVPHHGPASPHFELPRWREANAATTEGINAERTINGFSVSVILSRAAWIPVNNQSQTCCFTHSLGGIPGSAENTSEKLLNSKGWLSVCGFHADLTGAMSFLRNTIQAGVFFLAPRFPGKADASSRCQGKGRAAGPPLWVELF